VISEVVVGTGTKTATDMNLFAAQRASYSYQNAVSTSVFPNPSGVPNVVWMDDCDGDSDGVQFAAQVMVLHDQGRINLLGMIATSAEPAVAPLFDILLRDAATRITASALSNRTTVRVGAWQGTVGAGNSSQWVADTVAQFRTNGGYGSVPSGRTGYESARTALRRMLAAAPDNSVVICEGGSAHSFIDLRDSPPDAVSSLSGWDLMAQKVRFCAYIGGRNDNITFNEPNVRQGLIQANSAASFMPVPFVLIPYECFQAGNIVMKGVNSTHDDASNTTHPWKFAWAAYGTLRASGNYNHNHSLGDAMAAMMAYFGRGNSTFGGDWFTINRWKMMAAFAGSGYCETGTYPGSNNAWALRTSLSTSTMSSHVQTLIDVMVPS
jgi:hypothetical protein